MTQERPAQTPRQDTEEVTEAEVIRIAEELGEWYGLPETIVERGRKTQVVLIERPVLESLIPRMAQDEQASARMASLKHHFESMVARDLFQKVDPEELKEAVRQEIQDAVTESASIFHLQPDGRRIIYIIEPQALATELILPHELLHSMGKGRFGERSGLRAPSSLGGGFAWALDEAATETLRLSAKFRADILTDDMLAGARYPQEVAVLAEALSATYLKGGQPFTVRRLARFYFSLEGMADISPLDLYIMLIQSAPVEQQGHVRQLIGDLIVGKTRSS